MKKIFEVTDKEVIANILDNAEYGTLALCVDNKPYSLPINFVEVDGEIYFHGSQRGKKMDMMKDNQLASFSVVESLSLLPSYFSSEKEEACPATQLFQSIIIEGEITLIDEYDEKVNALQKLMEKLQKEGGFKHLSDAIHEKMINVTAIFKLTPSVTSCKLKVGQHWNRERFEKVCENLEKRGTDLDLKTLKLIKEAYKN